MQSQALVPPVVDSLFIAPAIRYASALASSLQPISLLLLPSFTRKLCDVEEGNGWTGTHTHTLLYVASCSPFPAGLRLQHLQCLRHTGAYQGNLKAKSGRSLCGQTINDVGSNSWAMTCIHMSAYDTSASWLTPIVPNNEFHKSLHIQRQRQTDRDSTSSGSL